MAMPGRSQSPRPWSWPGAVAACASLVLAGTGLWRPGRAAPVRETLAQASGNVEACRQVGTPEGRRVLVRIGGNPVDFLLDIPDADAAPLCGGLVADRGDPVSVRWSPAGFRYRPPVHAGQGERRKFQPAARAWEISRGGATLVSYEATTGWAAESYRRAAVPWLAAAMAALGLACALWRRPRPGRASAEAR